MGVLMDTCAARKGRVKGTARRQARRRHWTQARPVFGWERGRLHGLHPPERIREVRGVARDDVVGLAVYGSRQDVVVLGSRLAPSASARRVCEIPHDEVIHE